MDGAIPASGSESIRKLSTVSPLGAFRSGSSASGKGAHAGLFEQLLSMPAPARVQPERTSAGRSDSSTAADREGSNKMPAVDRSPDAQPEKRPTSSEEDTEVETDDDQLALINLNAPAATPMSPAADSEDSSPLAPAQQLADERVLAEGGDDDQAAAGKPSILSEEESDPATTEELKTEAEFAVGAETNGDSGLQTRTAKTDRPAPSASSETSSEAATQSPVAIEDGTQPSGPDEELTQKETSSAMDPAAGQLSAAADAAAMPETDGQQHRGGNRAKWYERRSANATAQAEASAPRADASENTAMSAQAAGMAETVKALESSPPSSPGVTTSAAAGTTLVMPADTPIIANFVSSTVIGGTPPAQATVQPQAGDASAVVRGVEPTNPPHKSGSQETKAAAPEAQRTDNLTQAERVRLVQRISRSFARLGPTGGAINIKLHPPQLGSLNVQVKMEGRTMTAKLSTESAAAREVILESLPVLRGRLAEQGFEIASFQVEVADNNADGANLNQQQSADHSSGGDRQFERQVDYRRLAAMQRQQGEGITVGSSPAIPSGMAWQSLAHMDLQA